MAELNSDPNVIYTVDNLKVLRALNRECVDLIYLDPPFNSGKQWHNPIGKGGGKVGFDDIWGWDRYTDETLQQTIERQWEDEKEFAGTAIRQVVEAAVDAHDPTMGSYCAFMAPRLIEMHRVLKPDGTLYLHCDSAANSYLRLLLDAVFGWRSLRNEIIWFYDDTPGRPKHHFPRKHDTIYRYTKSGAQSATQWTFNGNAAQIRVPIKEESKKRYQYVRRIGGREYLGGREDRLIADIWPIPAVKKGSRVHQDAGYKTQKPIMLLERIIAASSSDGDVVLDPFCGCATSCVAAQKLGRRWIGIDIEPEAVKLCRTRLRNELQLFDETEERKQPPTPSDDRQGELMPRGRALRLELWKQLQQLQGVDKPRCPVCGEAPGEKYMEVDHIIPRSRGGEHTWGNVQLLCGPCNRSKGNKTMAQWRRDRALTGSR